MMKIGAGPGKTKAFRRDRSEDAFSPLVLNSETAEAFVDNANTDHIAVARTISEDCFEVEGGDLSSIEQRLIAQATTLDVIFTRLATQAASAMEWSGMESAERSLKMALKAQQQSAHTLKILIDMKQPRQVTIAKQANIGHQQYIDNGNAPPASRPHAHGENYSCQQNRSNELIQIGEIDHATLDSGITETSFNFDEKTNTSHSSMGAFDRAKNPGR